MTEPTDLRDQITQAQLVVVKVGTRLITRGPGQLNQDFLASLVGQIKRLRQDGRQLLVITSGAIHLGSDSLSRYDSKDSLSIRQAAAAVGQPALMQHYIAAGGGADPADHRRYAAAITLSTRPQYPPGAACSGHRSDYQ